MVGVVGVANVAVAKTVKSQEVNHRRGKCSVFDRAAEPFRTTDRIGFLVVPWTRRDRDPGAGVNQAFEPYSVSGVARIA